MVTAVKTSKPYLARAPHLVDKTAKLENARRRLEKFQAVKKEFFSPRTEESIRAGLSKALSAARGKPFKEKAHIATGLRRKWVYRHDYKNASRRLYVIDERLKEIKKDVVNSFSNKEKQLAKRLVKSLLEPIKELYDYSIPESNHVNHPEFTNSLPRVFRTRYDNNEGMTDLKSKLAKYERELADLGTEDSPRTRFLDRALLVRDSIREGKKDDLKDLLQGVLRQKLEKIWSRLNRIAGNSKYKKLSDIELAQRPIAKTVKRKKVMTLDPIRTETKDETKAEVNPYIELKPAQVIKDIKDQMQQALKGQSLAGARRRLGQLKQKFLSLNKDPLNFAKAKVLAAFKFARYFLRRGEKVKVPDKVVISSNQDKDKNIVISRSTVKGVDRIGKQILVKHGHQALAA